MKHTDCFAAIIGGGAAGMMCALKAAENNPGEKIIILEKADRVGKKLLVTGNGRCNLSHIGAGAAFYHGEGSEELINILFKKYNSDAVQSYFDRIGLMTVSDSEGRVYPRSNQASSVLDVLRMRLRDHGVEEYCGVNIREIRKVRGGYELLTDNEIIATQKLIMAVGGKADYAGRESGADILTGLGLASVKPTPSLTPVKVEGDILRSLKGIRTAAQVSLIRNGEVIKTERGELQFADGALSGICVFNLSRYENRHRDCEIAVALLPEMTQEAIYDELKRRAVLNRNGAAADIFIGLFHKNIGNALLKEVGIKPSALCKDISDKELYSLAERINNWRFKTIPRHDFKSAQVTAGGVKLSEINHHTFESKRHKGLYVIGEALDVDGDCGGYNLQFAFASGMCAGDHL